MKSIVSIVKEAAPAMDEFVLQAVRRSIELVGGLSSFDVKGKQVLVKPNIGLPNSLDCTNPQVTWAAAKIFADYGCEVLLGEDPAIPTSEEEAYGFYRIHEIAERAGARVVSLRKGGTVKIKVPNAGFFTELAVSRIAHEAAMIVSVACLKTVNVTNVSLSLKNMKGVIPGAWKRKFHSEGLNHGIVDLNRVVKPGLAIVDATLARDMIRKACYPSGLIFAGKDAVAVDAVCCRFMGFDPAAIEHLKLAAEAGLGVIGSEEIELKGDEVEPIAGSFRFSSPNDPFKLASGSNGKIEIVQGQPCSACINELGQFVSLYADYLKEHEPISILVGPSADPSSVPEGRRIVYYGNCLRKKRRGRSLLVRGCPPNEAIQGITDSLGAVIDQERRQLAELDAGQPGAGRPRP